MMFPASTAPPSVQPNEASHLGTNIVTINTSATTVKKNGPQQRSRGVSLLMLIHEKILDPGKDALTMDYLGEKYTSDLLESGKIAWNDKQFASPSAWAIYVKKQIDPSKKSGCGWNSVKYRGKKLDIFKSMYNKKFKPSPSASKPVTQGISVTDENSHDGNMFPGQAMKHSKLKDFAAEIHPNTLVECEGFDEASSKVQPFFVTVSSNCSLLINFHCHLTSGEVVGYLGGKWDQDKQCLNILQAFPCKCKLGDHQNAAVTEEQIRLGMQSRGLVKVGWYHSHPTSPAEPTLRDIDCQMQYQTKFSANNPILALICSPSYETENPNAESTMNAFWVAPPVEQSVSPNASYGIPMRFAFSEIQDLSLTPDLYQELSWLVDYYALATDLVNFSQICKGSMTYMDRLKFAIFSKMPKDGNPGYLVQLLQKLATTSQ